MMEKQPEDIRLDKWLWAARFFKTRSQAAQAVSGGKVHLNGNRTKPAHPVQINDKLVITKDGLEFRVTVLAVVKYRRPAVEACQLYLESEESIQARQEYRELRKMAGEGFRAPSGKPSKRDRRKIINFTRKN